MDEHETENDGASTPVTGIAAIAEANPYTTGELLDCPKEKFAELDGARLEATGAQTLAQFLERQPVDDRRAVLRRMANERASEVLAEMDGEKAAEVLTEMRERRAVEMLERFAPDDAADIVAELDEGERDRLMGKVDSKTASTVRKLLAYDPNTAGGAMNPDIETLADTMTAAEAIAAIRGWTDEGENLHYIYVLDGEKRLTGSVSLKHLIQALPTDAVDDVMNADLSSAVDVGTDREKVALKMAECNLPELPVINADGVLLGVITHDDVIDIMREEATEDMQVMSGAGGDEGIHDNIFYSVRKRLPWLQLNLGTASIAAGVVICFQHQIGQMPLLAGLMPIVAGIGGNCGQQTLAVTIRSLALGEIHDSDTREVFYKQILIGIINGVGVGLVASLLVTLFTKNYRIGGVLMVATMANMALGGLVGAAIPLVMRKLNRDPAQCSSIVLTAITDTGGFLIFLSLGTWLLL
jgi:magnesium transporter